MSLILRILRQENLDTGSILSKVVGPLLSSVEVISRPEAPTQTHSTVHPAHDEGSRLG